MMYCPNCGKQLPDGAAFCGYCGAQTGAGASPQGNAAEAESGCGAPEKRQNNVREPAGGPKRPSEGAAAARRTARKKRKGKRVRRAGTAVVLAAVLLVLCLIGFFGSGFLTGSSGKELTVTFVTDTDALYVQTDEDGAVSDEDGTASGGEVSDENGTVSGSGTSDEDGTSAGSGSSDEDGASTGSGTSDEDEGSDQADADSGNIGYIPDAQSVSYGGTASRPAYPTREGYVFGGWYTDEACTQEYDFSAEVTEGLTLYAKWLDPDSEEAQVTDEEYEEYDEVTERIGEIYDSYTADDGYVAEEDYDDVLDAVEEYIKTREDIVYYCRDEQSIYMEFESLLTYLCAIEEEGTLGDPSAQTGELLFMIEGSSEFQMAADDLTDQLKDWNALDITAYDDAVFTIEQLKSLESADVFIWTGHGTRSEALHSVLYTTEEATRANNKTYQSMIQGKEIVATNSGYYAVTAMFILHYFPDLDGSLVILNACYGGQDAYLSAAFLNKGAQAVMAYTGAVHKWYAYIMTWDVLRYLHGQGDDGIIYDLQDALGLAEEDFGDHSRVPDYLEDAIDDASDGSYDNVYDALWYESALYREGFFSTTLLASNETQAQIYAADEAAYDYTIWAGLQGSVSSDEEIDLSDVRISLVNETTGEAVDTVTPADDGSFSFEKLDGGENRYNLTVSYENLVITKGDLTVDAHRYLDLGEIELETVHVDISVKNEEGDFLSDADVVLEDAAGNLLTPVYTQEDDGDVFFEADVAAGDYTVRVSADGYEDLSEEAAISAGTTLLAYVLEEQEVDWAQVYLNYLADTQVEDGFLYEEEYVVNGSSYEGFGLIYVNDDEIPELVLYGLSEATGAIILSVTDDGEADALQTYRLGYDYVEYGNLIDIGGGNNGLDTNTLYEIDENGEWSFIIEGKIDYNTETYTWDSETVSEAEYEDALADYYSEDDLADSWNVIYYSLQNIRNILQESTAG